jgi:hypothetical protein
MEHYCRWFLPIYPNMQRPVTEETELCMTAWIAKVFNHFSNLGHHIENLTLFCNLAAQHLLELR